MKASLLLSSHFLWEMAKYLVVRGRGIEARIVTKLSRLERERERERARFTLDHFHLFHDVDRLKGAKRDDGNANRSSFVYFV